MMYDMNTIYSAYDTIKTQHIGTYDCNTNIIYNKLTYNICYKQHSTL